MIWRQSKAEEIFNKWPSVSLNGHGKVNCQIQYRLFAGERSKYLAPLWMGMFYEAVSAAMYNGKLTDWDDTEGGRFCPDVRTKRHFIESKAVRLGHHLLFLNRQYESYHKAHLQGKRVLYSIFRHRFVGIRSFQGQADELWLSLANCTVFGLVFPFELMKMCVEGGEAKHYPLLSGWCSRRRKGEPRENGGVYRISSTFINSLFLDPVSTISDLNGIQLIRQKRAVISGIEVNGIKVAPMPVLRLYCKEEEPF